jgi:hypothetical protein
VKAFEVKAALQDLITAAANGRYRVIGVKNRSSDAKPINETPQVTVYYTGGQFPKNKSSTSGAYGHDASYTILVLAGAKVGVDLDTLDNPDATDEERAAALNAETDASVVADEKCDAVIASIFNTVMQPMNRTLGLDWNPQRWLTAIEKNPPNKQGGIVLSAASIIITATAMETTDQEIGTDGVSVTVGEDFKAAGDAA